MTRGDWFFVLIVLLIVLALILVVLNINPLFPTPEPQAFAQSLVQSQ